MDSGLGTGGGDGAHGTDHEVLEEQVRVVVAAGVLAEVGDLATLGLALERAAIRASRIELGCRAEGAGGGGGGNTAGGGSGDATRECAGRNGERRHLKREEKRRKKRKCRSQRSERKVGKG